MKEYHYSECGLNNIYLVNGYEITKHNGDEEIFIHDIHGLHKAIGTAIVFKPGVLIGDEIKFMRTTLDFSQKRLATLLGCSYQTVLLWEKNKTPITLSADRLLRVIFYEYINHKVDRKIYDIVNEIADSDAEDIEKNRKIQFEEISCKWKVVA